MAKYIVWGKDMNHPLNQIGGTVVSNKFTAMKKKRQWQKKYPGWRFYIRRYD